MNKKTLLIILVFMLALTACAKASLPAQPQMASKEMSADYGRVESAPAAQPAGNSSIPALDTKERMVIRSATMKVSVADPNKSMQDVSSLAASLGGYVVSSEVGNTSYRDGITYTSSSITIRVPADKLDETMAKIRAMAADSKTGVIAENVSGEDVTSDYVDSESRLNNLKAAEKQLQELLDNAKDLQYTLDIFKELTEIRGQIEVLQGHMKFLKESAQLSSVTVSFVAEASLKPIQIGGWKPEGTAKEALQALINAAQDLGTFLIWFAIAWLPFLIPLGLIIYFIVKGVLKKKAERQTELQHSYYYAQPTVSTHPTEPHTPQDPEKK
ncbi:MAG: DUF4349 domain-containing protein [Anaerolineaceae bacterium]|nr:DUF4349 domain-containing protein [Anaerolineaceae bacterium]